MITAAVFGVVFLILLFTILLSIGKHNLAEQGRLTEQPVDLAKFCNTPADEIWWARQRRLIDLKYTP